MQNLLRASRLQTVGGVDCQVQLEHGGRREKITRVSQICSRLPRDGARVASKFSETTPPNGRDLGNTCQRGIGAPRQAERGGVLVVVADRAGGFSAAGFANVNDVRHAPCEEDGLTLDGLHWFVAARTDDDWCFHIGSWKPPFPDRDDSQSAVGMIHHR